MSDVQPPGQPKQKSKKSGLGIVIFALVATVVIIGLAFGPDFLADMETREILETGVAAEAEVLDYYDTGNRYNSNPEVRVTLQVRPRDGEPFRAVVNTVLSPVSLAKKPVGSTVHVKYDPNDRSRVAMLPF
jgi:hypothetical protein